MIDLFYAPTPNGHKITIALEELGLDYRLIPINILKDDQFHPAFLQVSPNNRIPAILDYSEADGPLALFESGAILTLLAEKHQQFLPQSRRARAEVLQWLNWQMGGLGPMLGQNHHFNQYAPEPVPYAQKRYTDESRRLYSVLEKQLQGRDYVAGDYSIADMAIYPWIRGYENQKIDIEQLPNVAAYLERMAARDAVKRAYAQAETFDWEKSISAEKLNHLLETAPKTV